MISSRQQNGGEDRLTCLLQAGLEGMKVRSPCTQVTKCTALIVVYVGVGTVVQHGEGVSHPPLGARVGTKWYSSVCEKCGK